MFFGTTAEFWMNLQTRFELEAARRAAGRSLERIEATTAEPWASRLQWSPPSIAALRPRIQIVIQPATPPPRRARSAWAACSS
jgi:hypothetical protein